MTFRGTWFAALLLIVGAAVGSTLAARADSRQILRGRKLVLEDSEGRERIHLGVRDRGPAVFRMASGDGESTLGISVADDGDVAILIRAANGRSVTLGTAMEGSWGLAVGERPFDENTAAFLGVSGEDAAQIQLQSDGEPRRVVLYSSAAAGSHGLVLCDGEGRIRGHFRVEEVGAGETATLKLLAPDGEEEFSAGER
jgi:hypothetical protein